MLLAFVADRRATVDTGYGSREAATPAADALCSNQSISPARGAHSSKPAACRKYGARCSRQTGG